MHRPLARTCCLDLDTFFVSVERLLDPSLEGRPVVVGGRKGGRGVVTAASYEVRAYGVRSGMPVGRASRLAPEDAVFLPTRFGTYAPYAERVKAVLERFTPVVQTASIDEFFLDFRGTERLYRRPSDPSDDAAILRVVQQMRAEIRAETGLPASAGVGTTRPIAKIASGRAKPDGALLVPVGAERAFLHPLPVRRFPGIGPTAEARLVDDGIETLGDLLDLPPGPLRQRLRGVRAPVLRAAAGQGRPAGPDRPAFTEHDPAGRIGGSISNERTFHADLRRPGVLRSQLQALAERVAWRLRRRGAVARTLTVRIRYADFHTITRSSTGPPTAEGGALTRWAWRLFDSRDRPRAAIRLLGVGASGLQAPGRQLALPLGAPGRPPVSQALDAVRDRYGFDAIQVGARRLRGVRAGGEAAPESPPGA